MTQPLISVVLPTYNRAELLDSAARKCLACDWQNLELIIVNDGSKDATADVIARLERVDSRVRGIHHDRNKRLPAALNTGFSATLGDFVTWISDDNDYYPHGLSTLADALQREPTADIAHSRVKLLDGDGNLVWRMRVAGKSELMLWNCIGFSFLMRRGVYERTNGYADDLFLAEDYDFWLQASETSEFVQVDEELCAISMHADSLTMKYQGQVRSTTQRVILKHIDRLSWLTPLDRARGFLQITRYAMDDRRYRDATQFFSKSIVSAPQILAVEHRAVARALIGEGAYHAIRDLIDGCMKRVTGLRKRK